MKIYSKRFRDLSVGAKTVKQENRGKHGGNGIGLTIGCLINVSYHIKICISITKKNVNSFYPDHYYYYYFNASTLSSISNCQKETNLDETSLENTDLKKKS